MYEPPRHIRLLKSRRTCTAPPVSFSGVRTATHSCIRPFICPARLTLKAFYHRSWCRCARTHAHVRSARTLAREKGKLLASFAEAIVTCSWPIRKIHRRKYCLLISTLFSSLSLSLSLKDISSTFDESGEKTVFRAASHSLSRQVHLASSL